MPLREWALPKAGGAPEPPERRLFWQTLRKEPRAKTFRFVPALPAALAKQGCSLPSARSLRGGVARGFAGLGEPDGLSSWGGVRYRVLSRWRAVCIRIVDYARASRERFARIASLHTTFFHYPLGAPIWTT